MNGQVYFNSNQVKEVQKRMYELVSELVEDIKEVSKAINYSEDFFDTPSASHFRDVSKKVLSIETNYIKEEVFHVIKLLDTIIANYSEFSMSTSKSINRSE